VANTSAAARMIPPEIRTKPPQTFKRFVQGWAINTLAVALAALVLRGIDYRTAQDLLLAALLLGILNTFVRPLLLRLALPLLILTLGLFMLVINALLLMLVGQLVPGFQVASFGWALAGAAVIGFVSLVLNLITGLSGARFQMHQTKPPTRPPRHDDDSGPVIDV